MIASFADKGTADLFHGRASKDARRFPADMIKIALRKLDMLNAAASLNDMKVPPGNRLEALKGNLAGKHSIRVNDQWRIVFAWMNNQAHGVALTDYH